ncbi:hypothetical protein AB0D49_23170 [Streptomyces sp. NPDC048290]|uniref:hypothetical protein n=1 Tax=Streptomyces sp. NPDC048290 TaxID=3155811 RepID=UPI00342A34C7
MDENAVAVHGGAGGPDASRTGHGATRVRCERRGPSVGTVRDTAAPRRERV